MTRRKGEECATFMYLTVTTATDCGNTYPLDADEDELIIYQEGSGATTVGVYDLMYKLPSNFSHFNRNISDALSIRAKQSGGGTDMTLSIELYDNAGANASDGSIATHAVTGSWATYDAAITDPDGDMSFSPDDHVIIKISTVGIHADDDIKMTFPKLYCVVHQ